MQNKLFIGGWVLVAMVIGGWPHRAEAFVATNSAQFKDWQDSGCRMYPGGAGSPSSEPNSAGGDQAYCPDCPSPDGIPRWRVDEPYLNLFITDEPLSYYTSSGQKMTFRWHHKQRYMLPSAAECPTLLGVYVKGSQAEALRLGQDSYCTQMRNHSMTNACWAHNWMMDILFWDPNWETNHVGSVFLQGFQALVFRPEGAIYYFQSNSTRVVLSDPVSFATLAPLSALGYPLTTNQPFADTNGTYWGDPGIGFKLAYPDGSQDILGLATYNNTNLPQGNTSAHAFLTQRIDPQGRATRVGYEYVAVAGFSGFRVRYVVDSDGRTNTFTYLTNGAAHPWQVTQVADPYGRTARFTYLTNLYASGVVGSIQDAQSNTTYFDYLAVVSTNRPLSYLPSPGWVTAMTTPYGDQFFSYGQSFEPGTADGYSSRSLLVSEPEGAHQFFCYVHNNSLVTNTAPAPGNPLGELFDNGTAGTNQPSLTYRNTFWWGERQFSAISSNALSWVTLLDQDKGTGDPSPLLASLTASDYRKARLRHWLWQPDGISISEFLSNERAASPDATGQVEGARTWYDYANKPSPEVAGEAEVACAAQLLPDNTTCYAFYHYNPANGLVGYNARTYSLPGGVVGTLTNSFTYAANGIDLIGVTNSCGQRVDLAYNTNHQVLFITNALQQVTSLAWDASTHNLTNVALPEGESVVLSYAPPAGGALPLTSLSAMLTNISFSPQNLSKHFPAYYAGLPQVVHSYGAGLPDLWLTNSWDGLNRLTGTVFPDGTTTSNRYTRLDLTGQKDRLGNWTAFGYDELQHLTAITNALTNVTLLSWCGCGSLQTIIDALNHPTVLNYNNQGLLTNVAFADGSCLFYQRDALGRTTNAVNASGQGFGYVYNNQGLVTVVSNAFGPVLQKAYDALNRLAAVTNADGVASAFHYDLLDRVTNRLWSDGIGEAFVYSTNGLIAYTNRDGRGTLFTRDGAERLLGATNANLETTAFAYNAVSDLTELWDGRTNHTGWAYNEYGWLTNKVDARGLSVLSLAFDANGQVTNRVTPQFGLTLYGYDVVGNLTNITYPGTATPSITYYYDANGQLTNMTDAIGPTSFAYTPAGQRQMEAGPWASDTLTISYTNQLRQLLSLAQPGTNYWNQSYSYDAAFRLRTLASPAGPFTYGYSTVDLASSLVQSLVLPNNAFIQNGYDSLDRLNSTALLNRWGHILDGYSYLTDPLGLRTNLTRNLGLTTSTVSVGYDAVGQLTSWSAVEATNTLRLHEQFGFAYDPAHNLSFRTNGLLVQTFHSDAVNQLTNITRTGELTISGATPVPATNLTVNGQAALTYGDFTFASANNALIEGQNAFTVIAQNRYGQASTNTLALNLPQSVSLQYDLNGNLTSDGTRSFAYDPENELISAWVINAWRSDFVYDGLRRRRITRDFTWSSATGAWQLTNETRYICDGFLPVQERDSNNAVKVTYTRGLDLSGSLAGAGGIAGLLALSLPGTNGLQHFYYHADGAGNVTAMLDGQETMAARYLYGAFGKLTAQWGPMASFNSMGFSSMPITRQSGLSFYSFRAYDPSIQRWLTRDPAAERGGINLYGFVSNDPVNNVDPDGLLFKEFFRNLGHSLYNLMMGPHPETPLNPDMSMVALYGELGGIDRDNNVLSGAMEEGVGMAGDVATDYLAAEAGAKVLGAAAGVCKRIRLPRLHHAWPQYLGGPYKQELEQLPKALHDKYHSGLDKILPRQWDSDYYRGVSPQQQAENFGKFLNYTEAFDQKYGTHLVDALMKVAAALP